MLLINVIVFTALITILINFISKKKQFLIDKKFNRHKSFANTKLTPISGGLVFLITCLIFIPSDMVALKVSLFFIFLVGFLSDTNYLVSPIKRFVLQIIVILLFIFFSQSFINSVRLPIIDLLLKDVYFKYFLTIFCLLVLINGANFMDGVNTLLIGYFLGVSIVCLLIIKQYGNILDIRSFTVIIISLSVLIIFNFFGKLLSGDSGAYLISFFIGNYLVYISNLTVLVSPYFVACLLWYPAYECLFSIIRKKISKLPATNPDNYHLHQLIFLYLKKKFNLNGNTLNTTTGLVINLFNFIIFYNVLNNVSQTKNLLLIFFICLLVYNSSYFYLKKFLNK